MKTHIETDRRKLQTILDMLGVDSRTAIKVTIDANGTITVFESEHLLAVLDDYHYKGSN